MNTFYTTITFLGGGFLGSLMALYSHRRSKFVEFVHARLWLGDWSWIGFEDWSVLVVVGVEMGLEFDLWFGVRFVLEVARCEAVSNSEDLDGVVGFEDWISSLAEKLGCTLGFITVTSFRR
ncbi:hypothetical protein Droror1_Dr00002694 [Drosera rotundifolia]